MSLLETVFRESAPDIVTAQKEGVKTLYLKNQSLDNHKVHIITDTDSHIELPTHEQVALNNNPDVSLLTEGFYRELETCLAPNFIESDFDVILLNRTVQTVMTRNGFDVRSETMSRQLSLTPTGKKFEAYFDYFEPEYTACQTLLIQLNAKKVAAGRLAMGENTVVLTMDNLLEAKVDSFTFKDLDSKAMLHSGYYFLPLNIPNRNLRKTLNIKVDYDAAREDYSSAEKTLEVVTTRNDTAPFTVIRVASFERSINFTRSMNISTLSSKIYNSRRYIQVTHVVGDEPTEIVIATGNKSGDVTSRFVTPTFGKLTDQSFIFEIAYNNSDYALSGTGYVEELTGTHQQRIIRARNTTVTLQYSLGLTAVEKFGVIAYKIQASEGLQSSHNPELGLLTVSSVHAVQSSGYGIGSFAISQGGLGVGDAIAVTSDVMVAGVANALLHALPSQWYGDECIYIQPGETKHYIGNTFVKSEPFGIVRDSENVLERTATSLRVHTFYRYTENQIESYEGYHEIILPPALQAADKLYVYIPYEYYAGQYGNTRFIAEMSRVYPAADDQGVIPLSDDVGESAVVTMVPETILTDIQLL